MLMMIMRRCGSIGRKTRGGTAGAAGAAATGGGADGGGAAGVRVADRGTGLGAGGLVAGSAGAEATGAEGTAAAGGGAGGGGAAAAAGGAGGGEIALTAALQPPESRAMLRLRHSSASLPPGCTPEQLAMKSDRQLARIALVCSGVGCCACPAGETAARTNAAASADKPLMNLAPPAMNETPVPHMVLTECSDNAAMDSAMMCDVLPEDAPWPWRQTISNV